MGTPAHELIASVVLTSSTSTVTFSSITSSYRDLVVHASFNTDATSNRKVGLVTNTTGTSNASAWEGSSLSAGQLSVSAGQSTSGNYFMSAGGDDLANSEVKRGVFRADIYNYSNTTRRKSGLYHSGNQRDEAGFGYGVRDDQSLAINEITIFISANSFLAGSEFTLYGIEG